MSSTPRDAQAPGHQLCLLPSVAHTPSATQVPPAKKITFLKRGDPRFAGVRLAVHQRAFKSFSALMDELSQRVPLPFGVRSVTTPRGLHGLSALEQLQDGHYYLCSDRMPPRTPSGPGRPQGRSPSVPGSWDSECGHEAPGHSSSSKGPRGPRRITLVKNRDPRFQETVVLSHRNTRNLAAFLSKASDLLHFPVKQLYTTSGKKVDSLHTLLRSPAVLVCAGSEAFRPPSMETALPNRTKTARNKHSWGPRAQQSVMHARTRPNSQPQRLSLPSERSSPSDPSASLHGAWAGPGPDRHPQDTPAQPGPVVAGDDMEKRVRLNADGSLSVEMKVRFQLLGEDTLRWSQRVGRASAQGPGLGEVDALCGRWRDHPWGLAETGVQRLGPCEAGSRGALAGDQQPGPRYEIWRNPLFLPQGSEGLAQLSGCPGRGNRGDKNRKRHSEDSTSPASSAGCPGGSGPESCSPGTPGDSGGRDSPASTAPSERSAEQEAGAGLSVGGARPRSQAAKGCHPGSAARAGPHQEAQEQGGRPRDGPSQVRAGTSRGKATQGPLSLSSAAPRAELSGCRPARAGPVAGLSPAPGPSGSGDAEESRPSPPICSSAPGGPRKWQSPASAVSSPGVPGLSPEARRGRARQRGDTLCPQDWPAAPHAPRPGGPAARASQNTPRAREQASADPTSSSGDLTSSTPGSPDSQELPAVTSATVTPASYSDKASGLCRPGTCSAGPEGATECRACSQVATPTHGQGAGGQGGQVAGTPGLCAPSAPPARRPGREEAGAHHGRCCSHTGAPPILGTPGGQARAPWGPFSEACPVCGRYCPAPPGGRPRTRKQTSSSGSGGGGHPRADDGPAGVGPEVECAPESGTVGRTGIGAGRSCPRPVAEPGEAPGDGEGPGEEQSHSGTPGALPSASPDAVVREWLGKIPEEPLLSSYEMVEETTHGPTGLDPEGPSEEPARPSLGDLTQARPQPLGGGPEDHPEPNRGCPGAGGVGPRPGDSPHQVAAPDDGPKAPVPAPGGHDVSLPVLPGKVCTSTRIMKALLGSSRGRPCSLPEVSGAEARRLSHSAGALLACIAGLQFCHGDLGSPGGKARLGDSPGYQELLSISQTLWPGGGPGRGQLDVELTSRQALPVTENFTPTSSSGVDVNSGSGGSGEGSAPGAVDCALVPETMERPPGISQRADSSASGHLADVGAPRLSCPTATCGPPAWAHATSGGNEDRGIGEQASGDKVGWPIESSMQAGGRLAGASEEIENQRLREEGADEAGSLEDPRVGGQESSGAGSQDGEGPGEAMGGDPASAGLCRPGRTETATAHSSHALRERDSNSSDSQAGPKLESSSKEPPRGASAMGCGRGRARSSPGAREMSVPLDPDSGWVSKLLKKMEKAFLAHLSRATAELRARWGLQDHGSLDRMVAELERDVGLRLQDSTEREIRKIQSRAGRGALRGQASLQTEHRRRRLQGLRDLSAFSERAGRWGTPSLTLEEGSLGAAPGTRPGGEAKGDEFCPCEACVRKKVTATSPKDTAEPSSAPIKTAFDLRHILQRKKEAGAQGEAAEGGPAETGARLPRAKVAEARDGAREPGLGAHPRAGKAEESQGGPGPCGGGDPEPVGAEGAGRQDREEDGAAVDGSLRGPQGEAEPMAEGLTQREGALQVTPGDADTSEARGGWADGVGTAEAQEAGGEGEPESEGGSQEKGGGPGQGQKGEASPNGSTDQEGKPGLQSQGEARSSGSPSLGSCSRASQKGSEEGHSSGDPQGSSAEGAPHSERRVSRMYPESSSSDQEGAPSAPRTPEPGVGEKAGRIQTCALAWRGAEGFSQEDLDF